MTTTASNTAAPTEWRLMSFDKFCLGMVIKGAWIYDTLPTFEVMQSALVQLLRLYPHLIGYYNSKRETIVWSSDTEVKPNFVRQDLLQYSKQQVMADEQLLYRLVPKYDIAAFKKGKLAAFSAVYVRLSDGVALVLQCAHATMDAHSFYGLTTQWAALCKGEAVQPMYCNQALYAVGGRQEKTAVQTAIEQDQWPKMQGAKMLRMLFNVVRASRLKRTATIRVTQQELAALKQRTSCGTNAVLCAIAAQRLLQCMPMHKEFGIIEVADLRGRMEGVENNFFGNMSQAITLRQRFKANQPLETLIKQLHEPLTAYLSSAKVAHDVRLIVEAQHHKLPYYIFDASKMFAPTPDTLYFNNQLKFKACEIDFGTGLPQAALANDLTDMVKIWQPTAGGDLHIIFTGFAAKMINTKLR